MTEFEWELFKTLRTEGRIGRVWPSDSGNGWRVAPLSTEKSPTFVGYEHHVSNYLSNEEFSYLLYRLSGLERKPPKRENGRTNAYGEKKRA